ncbi:hypothetical protein G6F57_011936 [Rhizopus arrhizus]|nr:hypothetical protein G6F24_012018 [Rhizopus arrhizus]KAG0775110.1 hypothetical protein G6F22_013550 [Rhizopus arrhizus]KAG0804417.1 hypothetical protein G6F20_012716 [Rhizopus arrhizus]KAG0862490.1 hypothetical protein G6F16_012492 [Rhizopus arrhizus]KAG0866885.1 hypothetical protein G6F15_012551 [Rhizopus arrhizus]
MSQPSTSPISLISQDGVANVNITNPSDMQQALQYLLHNFETLQQRVSTHDDLFAELTALRSENATLKAKIASLEAQISAGADVNSSSALSPLVSDSESIRAPQVASPINKASYGAIAAKAAATTATTTRRPPSKKRKLAASRPFQPVDPSAPRGFEYLYLHRNRKLSRAEIRRNLRLLGLDLSRVLDICFPGPKAIGLLIHVLYKEEVISLLSAAKVPLVDGFDPLDPVNLADPELQHLSLADKANECAELQFTRCSRALSRLGAGRAHLVGPIGKYFSSKGWIDEDSLSQILSSLPPSSFASRGRDPGAAFRGDTVMSDALVSDSASAGSHSL